MAVSRKAMTEGIRTFLFPGTLNKARFYNPSVSCADSSLYTREPGVLPHQRADEGIGPYKILIGLQSKPPAKPGA